MSTELSKIIKKESDTLEKNILNAPFFNSSLSFLTDVQPFISQPRNTLPAPQPNDSVEIRHSVLTLYIQSLIQFLKDDVDTYSIGTIRDNYSLEFSNYSDIVRNFNRIWFAYDFDWSSIVKNSIYNNLGPKNYENNPKMKNIYDLYQKYITEKGIPINPDEFVKSLEAKKLFKRTDEKYKRFAPFSLSDDEISFKSIFESNDVYTKIINLINELKTSDVPDITEVYPDGEWDPNDPETGKKFLSDYLGTKYQNQNFTITVKRTPPNELTSTNIMGTIKVENNTGLEVLIPTIFYVEGSMFLSDYIPPDSAAPQLNSSDPNKVRSNSNIKYEIYRSRAYLLWHFNSGVVLSKLFSKSSVPENERSIYNVFVRYYLFTLLFSQASSKQVLIDMAISNLMTGPNL